MLNSKLKDDKYSDSYGNDQSGKHDYSEELLLEEQIWKMKLKILETMRRIILPLLGIFTILFIFF